MPIFFGYKLGPVWAQRFGLNTKFTPHLSYSFKIIGESVHLRKALMHCHSMREGDETAGVAWLQTYVATAAVIPWRFAPGMGPRFMA